jgi:hypothetical protein
MRAFHRSSPFDFAITLGDNFYPVGMLATDDPRWQSQYEALYTPLGIPFYATRQPRLGPPATTTTFRRSAG